MRLTPLFQLVLFLLISTAHAGEVTVNMNLFPVDSFTAKTKNIKGRFIKKGKSYVATDVKVDLSSLKTGIKLRDKHMKNKYLEVKKPGFRHAIVKDATASEGKLSGTIVIRGVTQKFTGKYEIDGAQFIGKFPLKISDFKIKEPRYMGVGVEDEIEVMISLPTAAAKGSRTAGR